MGTTFTMPKEIKIVSWKLAVAKWSLALIVFCVFVLYGMLYKGSHLDNVSITGWIDKVLVFPLEEDCVGKPLCKRDFENLSEKTYCSQNLESRHIDKKSCQSRDVKEVLTEFADRLEISTWIQKFEGSWSIGSDGSYIESDPKQTADYFVASVGSFILKLRHFIRTKNGTVISYRGMKGFSPRGADQAATPGNAILCKAPADSAWCQTEEYKQPIMPNSLAATAAHTDQKNDGLKADSGAGSLAIAVDRYAKLKHVNRYRGLSASQERDKVHERRRAQEDRENRRLNLPLLRSNDGDELNIKGWLNLAGMHLDDPITWDDAICQRPEDCAKTFRSCGLSVTIHLIYTNAEPWIGLMVTPWSVKHPRYSIRVSNHPVACSVDTVRATVDSSRNKAYKSHKIQIEIEQDGNILEWDAMKLLITLATFVSSVSVIWIIMDKLLQGCTSWYQEVKFDRFDKQHQPQECRFTRYQRRRDSF